MVSIAGRYRAAIGFRAIKGDQERWQICNRKMGNQPTTLYKGIVAPFVSSF